jgi:hypothetical protein
MESSGPEDQEQLEEVMQDIEIEEVPDGGAPGEEDSAEH